MFIKKNVLVSVSIPFPLCFDDFLGAAVVHRPLATEVATVVVVVVVLVVVVVAEVVVVVVVVVGFGTAAFNENNTKKKCYLQGNH